VALRFQLSNLGVLTGYAYYRDKKVVGVFVRFSCAAGRTLPINYRQTLHGSCRLRHVPQ
jgi:hypothetical protein